MRAGGFGSALVATVGMLGIDHTIPLLTPMSRVPLTVRVGRAGDRAVVVGGRVEARPVFEVSVTLDHRFVDGWQARALARSLRGCFADPAASD